MQLPRIGVIGVGHLGSIHARILSGINTANFVGVFDSEVERARGVASELGVTHFATSAELFAAVDCACIVTPTSTHAEVAAMGLDSGVHLFIEKPITATYAQAAELLREAAQKKLIVQVGHIERFNPAIASLAGVVLNPMFIEAHRLAQFTPRATDVAVVLDLMIHDIDLVLTMVRSDLVDIRSSGVSVVSDSIDIASARLEFRNGCVANLTASRISQRPMRKMRIFQNNAYISIDLANPNVEIFQLIDGEAINGAASADGMQTEGTMLLGEIERGNRRRQIVYRRGGIEEQNALQEELRSFVHAVASGGEPRVTGESAAEALRIAEEIMEDIHRRSR